MFERASAMRELVVAWKPLPVSGARRRRRLMGRGGRGMVQWEEGDWQRSSNGAMEEPRVSSLRRRGR